MKKIVFLFIITGLFLMLSCSQKQEKVKLTEGTPAYELAKELSKKLPALDPDENKVLVSTEHFDITSGEVVQNIQTNLGSRVNLLQQYNPESLKQFVQKNANDLAEKKLLINAAKEANVTVSKAKVDSILQLQYSKMGGKEKFQNSLEKQNISLEFVRGEMRKGLLIQDFLDEELGKQINVTANEVEKAYEKDKTATVRHILLKTQGKSEEEKAKIREKMERILKEARSEKDFAELARKYSEDEGSKKKGGLYKNFGHGQMVKPFEEAAFSVPKGEISDIIETRFGYHILKVVDRKRETRPLDEVRPQLKSELEKQKRRDVYRNFVEQLKEDADYQMTGVL